MKRFLLGFLCCLGLALTSFSLAIAAEMTAEEKAYRDKIEFFDVHFDKKGDPNFWDVSVDLKMRNNGDKEVYGVTVRARFLDANGEVFTTYQADLLSPIFNNMKGPFIPGQIWVGHTNPKVVFPLSKRLTPAEAAQIKDYKLEILEIQLSPDNMGLQFSKGMPAPKDMNKEEAAYLKNIKLEDLSIKTKTEWGSQILDVFCKIQNTGNKNIKMVYLRSFFYDEHGNLIFVDDSGIYNLKAGETKENEDDLKPMFSVRDLPLNWDDKTVKVEILSVKL